MLELFIYGIVLGSIISLGAIGLTLIYGILRFGNFAHGDLMTAGAYIALFFVTGPLKWVGIPDNMFGPFSFGWRMVIAFPLSMLAVGGVAILLDRILYQTLRNKEAGRVTLSMSALGASFIVRMGVLIIWGPDYKFYKPGLIRPALVLPAGIKIRPDQILMLIVVAVLVTAVHLFLKKCLTTNTRRFVFVRRRTYLREFLFLSASVKNLLRILIDLGVTSSNSSSSIHSKARSSDISRGGISLIASSAPDERTFD